MNVTPDELGLNRYRRPLDDRRARWWAMSATFQRSLKARDRLDEWGVESFVPLRTVVGTERGRKVRRRVPAVSNLIFVRTTELGIQRVKRRIDWLHFLCNREQERNVRIVVPDDLMTHFMAVSQGADGDSLYLMPEEINLSRGDRVRIHGGPFDGVEGTFVKISGKRRRMVVVSIEGIISVATLSFAPELLEKIQ